MNTGETTANEAAEKILALFQNKKITVMLEDGKTEEVTVSQFKIREYDRAFDLADDEFGLVELACGKEKGWSQTIHPESFEALYAAVEEVNAKGFFGWCARKRERVKQTIMQMASIPEVGKVIMDAATSAAGSSKQPLRPAPTRRAH